MTFDIASYSEISLCLSFGSEDITKQVAVERGLIQIRIKITLFNI